MEATEATYRTRQLSLTPAPNTPPTADNRLGTRGWVRCWVPPPPSPVVLRGRDQGRGRKPGKMTRGGGKFAPMLSHSHTRVQTRLNKLASPVWARSTATHTAGSEAAPR